MSFFVKLPHIHIQEVTAMTEKESNDKKSTINLLAIWFAFIIGLTVGNIDGESLTVLKEQIFYKEGASLVSRTTLDDGQASSQPITDSSFSPSETEASAEAATSSDNNGYLTIYTTPTGKRYHYSLNCAGESGFATDLDEAEASGLTPCKKCAGG
jgi:hypothetical protein